MTPAQVVAGLDELLRSELADLEERLHAVASGAVSDDSRLDVFLAAAALQAAVTVLVDGGSHAEAALELEGTDLRLLVPWWTRVLAAARSVDDVLGRVLGDLGAPWRLEGLA